MNRTVTYCESIPAFRFAQPRLRTRLIDRISIRLRLLTGSVPRSTLHAEPPENKFAFAKNPLAERARGRLRHVVPLDVLNIAAAIADEVVMLQAFGIESCGSPLDSHFTHQTRLHQIPEIVIRCGS